ncbi:MAG: OsmC family protein [Vicinamibacterales bacterium]
MTTVHVSPAGGKYAQTIAIRHHQVLSDEGTDVGGDDRGATPTELLLGALGSCVAMTLQMYAGRKGWELGDVQVDLSGRDENGVFVVERRLTFGAPLSDEQKQRLAEIAGRCPVSRRITGTVEIRPVA